MKLKNIQALHRFSIGGIFAGLCLFACTASAQTVATPVAGAEYAPTLVAAEILPDAPSATVSSSSSPIADGHVAQFEMRAAGRDLSTGHAREASKTQSTIEPGQVAPAQSASDMMLMGVKDTFSVTAVAGWFTSAGYSHWMNSAPNYGTDRGAFGERLGAAALCNSSEDLLTESVMAPLLHEDARYYRMGSGHNFLVRGIYAATRPLITKTTSGRTTPNLALILGNAEGAALANAYYPKVNRGAEQTMENLGFSIGGSAIGDVLAEYFESALYKIHIRH